MSTEVRTHRCLVLMDYSNGFDLCDLLTDSRCVGCKRDDKMLELARPVLVDARGKRIRQLEEGEVVPKPNVPEEKTRSAAKRDLVQTSDIHVKTSPDVTPEQIASESNFEFHRSMNAEAETPVPAARPPKSCPIPSHGGRRMDGNGECSYCRKYRKKAEKQKELTRIAREAAAKGKAKVAARTERRKMRKAARDLIVPIDRAVIIPTEAADVIRERLRDYDALLRVHAAHPDVMTPELHLSIRKSIAAEIGEILLETRQPTIEGE